MTGNRCGHDPQRLRLADSASARLRDLRGRGGKPPILGEICAAIERAATRRVGLYSWHSMNESGRRRRTEALEQLAVIQWLILKDFKIETLQCGRQAPELGGFICADAKLYARQVSGCPSWKSEGHLFSIWRTRAILRDFLRCGYIRLSKQMRRHDEHGNWEPAPRVVRFTRKFFQELGGDIWQRLDAAGRMRREAIKAQWRSLGRDIKQAMRDLFSLRNVMTPRQAEKRKSAPIRTPTTDPP